MKISKRLEKIASLIPDGVRVIDVGCDHAYLGIHLCLTNINTTYLGIDISLPCIERASFNISKFDLGDRVKLLKNNGLENINIEKDDYVVLAGMGTFTILNIINKKDINNLIIQTNTDFELLEKSLDNYILENKIFINDNKRDYIIYYLKKNA